MKKSKALNATEISIVAALVFLISLGAVFTCGDYFAKIFGNNPILSMFTSNRGKNALVEDIKNYLSGISINLGGLNITSPVEDAFTETDGSLGDLQRHIAIIQDYIKMLEQIITELEEQGINADAFKKALQAYQDALTQYTEMNNLKVGDTFTWDGKSITISSEAQLALLKKAMDLDIMLDLTQNGSAASALNTALTSLLGKVDNETYKNLLEAFTKDLLSLGANTDFKVDSRLVGNNLLPQDLINLIFGGVNPNTGVTLPVKLKDTLTTITTTYTPKLKEGLTMTTKLFETLVTGNNNDTFISQGAINNVLIGVQILNDNGQIMVYKDGILVKDCASSSCSVAIGDNILNIEQSTYVNKWGETVIQDNYFKLDVHDTVNGVSYRTTEGVHVPVSNVPEYIDDDPTPTVTTTITTTGSTGLPADPEKLRDALIDILMNPTKYPDIDIEALTKTIDVYRNGTYVDMAENTYNNGVVCTSMGGTIQDGACTFN